MRYFAVFIIILTSCLAMGELGVIGRGGAAEQPPAYFQITLVAPTNDPARVQHAQVITQELWKIGIQADLFLVSWDVLTPRLFRNSGFATYADGGFDIGFIAWSDTPVTPQALSDFYHSNKIDKVAGGYNYYPVNNSQLDDLCDLIDTEQDFAKRRELVRQALDIIVWETHPVMGLYQTANPFALDADLRGFDAFRWSLPYVHPQELYYESGGQSDILYATNARFSDLNPALSTSYYDYLVLQPTQAWTYQQDVNMILRPMLAIGPPTPIGSSQTIASYIDLSTISSDSIYAGADASTTWGPNPNVDSVQYDPYKTEGNKSMFLINLRKDIPWHPGWGYTLGQVNVTIKDFEWTLRYWMNNELASPTAQGIKAKYGPDPSLAIEKINTTMMKVNLRGPLGNGQIGDWYDALALSPLPRHVLDPTFDATPYGGQGEIGVTPDGTAIAAYANHSSYQYNTGEKPVLGVGPYYFDNWDKTNQRATLRKFDQWGGYGANSLWNLEPYSQNNIDSYVVIVYSSKAYAEIALEIEEIDAIDSHFSMGKDIPYLSTKANIQIILIQGGSIQSMGYNTYHPKLSNLYVRLAISHMVPTQKIIDYILGGLGDANEVVGIPLANPYRPTEAEWKTLGLPTSENVANAETGDLLEFQGHICCDQNKAWALMEKAGYDMDPWRKATDATAPSVSSSSSELMIEVGANGHQIEWSVSDSYPAEYNITRNGILIENGTWSSGTITFDIEGLAVGIYTFRLTVWDAAGNIAEDEVTVIVVESSTTATTSSEPSSELPSKPSSEPSVTTSGLQLLVTMAALAAFSLLSIRMTRRRKD